ncbi:MAG: tetratricopeptide repeat protein [Thermoanaerobaculia bacterium]
MVRHLVRLIPCALVLALVAQPAAAQQWAGRGRAQGLVKDAEGNPLEGVKVTLTIGDTEDGPEPVMTNEDGRWAVGGLAGGSWRALLEKEGYVTAQGPVNVNEFGASKLLEVSLDANPFAVIDTGEELFEQGRYPEARAAYEEALPKLQEEGAARLRSRIGDTYLAEGDTAQARAQYEQALPYIPGEEQAHIRIQMASSYEKDENWSAARDEYEKVLPLLGADGQTQVLLQIARTHDVEEDRAGAISALERALEVDPDNAPALQLIADLLAREGRDEEAEAYLARLPADAELPPDMLLNAGIRDYNDNKMDEALAQFDRVVRQDPTLADAYYYRGLVHLNLGHNAEAKADLEKLLELAPNHPNAAEAQEFLDFLSQ